MSNKRKGIRKMEHDTSEKNTDNYSICARILKILIWVSLTVVFVINACVIAPTVYHIIKKMTTPVKLPQFYMNKYWGRYPINPTPDISIHPYKVEFSDVMINDLRERLMHQRPFQPPLEDSGFRYGFNSHYLAKVLDYWKNHYDFKDREKVFNKYNHYMTNIQGLNIHYIHVKPVASTDVKVLTLLLLHSWPGSVREFYDVIPKLTFPNPKYKFVFELIIPSLPGFGFSEAPVRVGMDPKEMAIVLSKLMDRIGHKKYYVHGGDIGHAVGSALATIFPNNVLGFHTSTPKIYNSMSLMYTVLTFVFPSIMVDADAPIEARCFTCFLQRFYEETGYLHIQSTKPDSIGIALTDSPAGLAAYILEKFSALTNPEYLDAVDGSLRNKFSLTQLLDNVMVYWSTNSITTAMRAHAAYFQSGYFNLDIVETEVPTWGLKLKHHMTVAPLRVLKRKYKNYLHETVVADGGTFAAMEYPKVLVNDIFAAVDTFIAFHDQNKMPQATASPAAKEPETVYDFSVTDIHGKHVSLNKYTGHVLLIVNVASQCGLTKKNYKQLAELYDEYEAKGLRILAFPCNQFGSQEPGSSEDIIEFTKAKGVRFDLFGKVEVNGEDAHPLWKFLKRKQSGTLGDWIKWNFSKFIVDSRGVPVERFGPDVDPVDLKPFIDKYIVKEQKTEL